MNTKAIKVSNNSTVYLGHEAVTIIRSLESCLQVLCETVMLLLPEVHISAPLNISIK